MKSLSTITIYNDDNMMKALVTKAMVTMMIIVNWQLDEQWDPVSKFSAFATTALKL